MIESLREKLVALIASIVPVSLSESEVGSYPYATYEMETVPVYAKDGIVRYNGTTQIYIVSKDFSQADTIKTSVMTALETGMTGTQWGLRLLSITKTCVEGIWTINLNYYFIQKS